MSTETENQEVELQAGTEPEGQGGAPKLEIEVVDDTPPADRGKTKIQANPDEETTDADLEKYSKDVQKRIHKAHRLYHDERRAREAAEREREQAIQFAKEQIENARKLEAMLAEGSKQLKDTSASEAQAALEAAKRQFKEAYDAGDAEKIAEAQEAIAAARYRKEQADAYKPLQFEEKPAYNPPQQTQPPANTLVPDERAQEWQAENPWFGEDDEMTSLALGLHQKLVKSGVLPTTEEYYERIDARMRELFPGKFAGSTNPPAATADRAKAGTVVAPATRSTAPKRVTLTQSQVAIARRLGLTPEQYAQELMKLKG